MEPEGTRENQREPKGTRENQRQPEGTRRSLSEPEGTTWNPWASGVRDLHSDA